MCEKSSRLLVRTAMKNDDANNVRNEVSRTEVDEPPRCRSFGCQIQHKSMFEKGKVQGCSHVCEKAVLFETL
jgi:hypothetical protein